MSHKYTFPTTQSHNINANLTQQTNFNSTTTANPFAVASPPNRIVGRNETQFDIRRTASGINPNYATASDTIKRNAYPNKKLTSSEKRFGSLEVRKHKYHTPTFYSMRWAKHKRRPIVIASPKDFLFDTEPNTNNASVEPTQNIDGFQNLTDSIQIFEQNSESAEEKTVDSKEIPVPAPRCRRHKKIRKASKCDSIMEESNTSNTSDETIKNDEPETSITEAQVHVSNDLEIGKSSVDTIDGIKKKSTNSSEHVSDDAVISLNSPNPSPKVVVQISPNFIKPKTESPKGALSLQIQAKIKGSPLQSPADNPNKTILSDTKDTKENKIEDKASELFPEIPQMPILNTQNKWSPKITNTSEKNAFYTLTTPHFKQVKTAMPSQYSATIPHQKNVKLIPKALFQEQLPKSKSFSSKTKQKKHSFQIPLQKCHSFKFQTAESYFQPIKNIHEENLIRNGYVSDYPESSHHGRHQKRDKPKQKTKGPLVLRRLNTYGENVHFQENMQNSVQLQYPQPVLGLGPLQNVATNRPNGVVYADLDMPASNNKKSTFNLGSSKTKSQKSKPKTEYATLKFNDVGQEIDV
ncbi:hypothetical protein NQ317_011749 [Molorchus minor]|uniref:Uncharacterized protein n=1 Tax=Molorchus minor TaxID=1323400 RepID=A0ABQ9JTB4_9CUCU|nr:hypothetical protein NQ317_011749 [Molorchus minor]